MMISTKVSLYTLHSNATKECRERQAIATCIWHQYRLLSSYIMQCTTSAAQRRNVNVSAARILMAHHKEQQWLTVETVIMHADSRLLELNVHALFSFI
jgi:hypothetical protein